MYCDLYLLRTINTILFKVATNQYVPNQSTDGETQVSLLARAYLVINCYTSAITELHWSANR